MNQTLRKDFLNQKLTDEPEMDTENIIKDEKETNYEGGKIEGLGFDSLPSDSKMPIGATSGDMLGL